MTSRFDSTVSVQMENAGRQYLPIALQLMDVTMRRRTAGELTMAKGYLRISDSAYAYAISAGGVNVLRIVAEDDETPSTIETLKTKFPDFLSGYIVNGTVEKIEDKLLGTRRYLKSFRPNLRTARLFKIPQAFQRVQKLDVLLYSGFEELGAPSGSPIEYTQYVKMHPTLYSGTMVKCVQLLMGFGRQAKKSIYEDKVAFADSEPDGEETEIPESVYQREVRTGGLRIRYDHRFMRTHGLTQANDGTWWVVEIGVTRGIVCMPLPLHEATTTPSFRATLTAMGDDDALDAIDLFGGFPSGEPIPSVPETFDAWERAGRCIRITPKDDDVGGFYQHDFYSSSMGWAFNPDGSEAHNTAWRIEDSDGCQRGVQYSVNLRIGMLPTLPVPAGATTLRNDFAVLRQKHPGTFDANMFKLGRLTPNQLADVQRAHNQAGLEAAYTVLDELIAAPMAVATGVPRKVHEGFIYWPSKIQPQIKFPEPLLGALLSHDMRPARRLDFAPHCDTIMHVFFQDRQLKTCRFYSNPSARPTTDQVGFDSEFYFNNPVGDMTSTTTTGPIAIPAMFYTSDFDDRRELGTVEVVDIYKRRGLGYTTPTASSVGADREGIHGVTDNNVGDEVPPFEQPDAAVHPPNIVWRSKLFRFEHWQTLRNQQTLGGAIAVPFNDRQAYYYAKMEGHAGGHDVYELTWMRYGDPWVGEYGENGGDRVHDPFQILHSHYLSKSDPDRSGYQRYQDDADAGDWVPVGSDVRGVVASTPYTYPPERRVFDNVPAIKTLTVFLVTNGRPGEKQTYTETRFGDDASLWDSWWFLPSPDDFGFTAYIAEAHNGWKKDECVVADQTLNATAAQKRLVMGTPQFDEFHSGMTFVGVL